MHSPSSSPGLKQREGRLWRSGPSIVALITLGVVLLTGQRGLFGLRLAEAPGLTLDEGFNVAMGVYLVRSLEQDGLGSLHPDTIKDVYGGTNYNPDHPPLGRWALGIVHEALERNPKLPFSEFDARPASGIAFALTVLVCGWFIQKWYGCLAGSIAAFSVAILPRQFAHAHLASLETFIGLTYALCTFVTADRCRPREGSSGWGAFAAAGGLFGLALLTKIQAVFLGPAVGIWALTQRRLKAVPRVALFGAVGLAVFFVGWPWLWLDPVGHFWEYFARTTERQTLYCYYWGQRWADRDVPWHYPSVIFTVTMPVGIHLLTLTGILGNWRLKSEWARSPESAHPALDAHGSRWRTFIDPRLQLVLWAFFVPMVVFALPSIRVYDGERLFGVVYPLWAALAGVGAAVIVDRGKHRRMLIAVGMLMVFQPLVHFAMNPFQLSFYNVLAGGPAGADRLGFERTYWMEQLTESFQKEIVQAVPRGSRIDVAPVLHPVYLPHLLSQSPILQSAGITLAAYDDEQAGGSKYVLLFHRKADPWASLDPPPEGTKILAEVRRAGVALATLLELPQRTERKTE